MVDEKARARAQQIAYERKQRQRKREQTITLLILIGIAITIFALGTFFGWHLTSHTKTQEASTPTEAATTTHYANHNIIEVSDAKVITSETPTKPTGVPGLSLDYDLQKIMYECCLKYKVPFALALAVAEKESNFNPDAVSKTDDHGLMQINRCNFEYLLNKGIDPLTYQGNIEAGILLLSENLELYGEESLAVMAYNCGRTGAKRLWNKGTYSTAYSRAVMELYDKWLGVLEV